jgi:hypothetical protein
VFSRLALLADRGARIAVRVARYTRHVPASALARSGAPARYQGGGPEHLAVEACANSDMM